MTTKRKPTVDNRPRYNVVVNDPKLLALAISQGSVPVGAMGINLMALREWARDNPINGEHFAGMTITKRETKASA